MKCSNRRETLKGMQMRYTFECDYNEGMAAEVLAAFQKTNMEQVSGYGMDPFTEAAKEKIRAACRAPAPSHYQSR